MFLYNTCPTVALMSDQHVLSAVCNMHMGKLCVCVGVCVCVCVCGCVLHTAIYIASALTSVEFHHMHFHIHTCNSACTAATHCL